MPIVNRALVKAGFKNISSIVTIFDSGGDSGRMRTDERGKILAFSDYWRSLMSLWKDGRQKEIWEEMLRFRDGRARNFGNTFFQFMSEKSGGLSHVDELFAQLTGADLVGVVIPVSNDPAEVCFETVNRNKFRGEHRLDELRMSLDRVSKIWLEPQVKANKEAVAALRGADYIIVCPGSMYGSVITNFLPKGIVEAYNKSGARKVLMTNIMSVANENNGFSQKEYIEIFERYLKSKKSFDLIIMAGLSFLNKELIDKVLKGYLLEHSSPIKFDKSWNEVETREEDMAVIEETNLRLRHSEEKMAKMFRRI